MAKIFLETKLLKIIRYVGNVSEYFPEQPSTMAEYFKKIPRGYERLGV